MIMILTFNKIRDSAGKCRGAELKNENQSSCEVDRVRDILFMDNYTPHTFMQYISF